jgi:hypothetical protein
VLRAHLSVPLQVSLQVPLQARLRAQSVARRLQRGLLALQSGHRRLQRAHVPRTRLSVPLQVPLQACQRARLVRGNVRQRGKFPSLRVQRLVRRGKFGGLGLRACLRVCQLGAQACQLRLQRPHLRLLACVLDQQRMSGLRAFPRLPLQRGQAMRLQAALIQRLLLGLARSAQVLLQLRDFARHELLGGCRLGLQFAAASAERRVELLFQCQLPGGLDEDGVLGVVGCRCCCRSGCVQIGFERKVEHGQLLDFGHGLAVLDRQVAAQRRLQAQVRHERGQARHVAPSLAQLLLQRGVAVIGVVQVRHESVQLPHLVLHLGALGGEGIVAEGFAQLALQLGVALQRALQEQLGALGGAGLTLRRQ